MASSLPSLIFPPTVHSLCTHHHRGGGCGAQVQKEPPLSCLPYHGSEIAKLESSKGNLETVLRACKSLDIVVSILLSLENLKSSFSTKFVTHPFPTPGGLFSAQTNL